MRRILVALFLSVVAASAVCGQAEAGAARAEVEAGARAYVEGRYAEAERRFVRAHELDPSENLTVLFIARAAHQQFRPGDATPANVAAAERAVAAYESLLTDERLREDAVGALTILYGRLNEGEKLRGMLAQHANDTSVPSERRARSFVSLARLHWKCSNEITERKENKRIEEVQYRLVVKYVMPADVSDFYKARQCVEEGLQEAEQAVALDENNAFAWGQKATLLREAAKLAEMGGERGQDVEYMKQYGEAVQMQNRLLAAQKKDGPAGDAPGVSQTAAAYGPAKSSSIVFAPEPTGAAKPPGPDPAKVPGPDAVTEPPPENSFPEDSLNTITGGVLDGEAVYKPQPAYPAEAKAARAQGKVSVRVVVDEEGKVIKAEAVSGHPLLRDAAVTAARNTRFSPPRVQGQPVKLDGVITYDFELK